LKNKAKTYILLVVVLGIWGAIGYKIINGIRSDAPQLASQEFDDTFKPKTTSEIEGFSIQKIERDPFMGTMANIKKQKTLGISKNMQQPNDSSKIIVYGGLVKRQNTKDQVFVVNINNNQYLLKKGQIADSIRLIRGNAKEIVISYNNKSQTIKRK